MSLIRLGAYALRALMIVGWLCVLVMAAHGSVHLHCAYPLAVGTRVLGFGMLVFCTSTMTAVLLDEV